MFKYFLVAALVACVAAVSDESHAETLNLKSDVREDGFDYSVDTSNSIHQDASGDAYGNIHGSYEYVSPEGEHIKVSYVANEEGYQPQSDVLPTPPPVPAAILKAIEYIRAHPHSEYHH